MTTFTLRLDTAPVTVVGNDKNVWEVTDPGDLDPTHLDFLVSEALPTMAALGVKPPGLPDIARYYRGVLEVFPGELLSIDPPFEYIRGRVY